MAEIGLFPLGIVLLPTERVPLHVFEERYKELVGECIKGGSDFGLVYAQGEELADVGTRARVAQVLTRFPDGRMNVLVEGGSRFLLDELTTGRSFHTAIVSPLDDDDDPAAQESIDRALAQFGRLREIAGSDVDPPDTGEPQLSFALAGRVELPLEDKLGLLRDVSERRRMDRVCELFEVAIVGAERMRLAAERATSNGRVELG
jgi:ATP-dependent Lon protease